MGITLLNLAVCFPLQLSENAFGYVTRDIQAQYFDSSSVYMCGLCLLDLSKA